MQATRRNFKLAVAARMQYRTSQRQNQVPFLLFFIHIYYDDQT
ncbi:hypothetical protein GOBAR_DD09316 [Gossypium barbadense]|nr:hypothetical protein GOBAR_DD09316 [Gossypium barbadense]